MQKNGHQKRAKIITMIRMLMYLVEESREQGFPDLSGRLQGEVDDLQSTHNIKEREIFPTVDDDED